MRYNTSMAASARRHLEAGERLHATSRRDVAGYLFGIAAECALKHLMLTSGMRPRGGSSRRDDPFYAHFQELKTMLRDAAHGRLQAELRRYGENDAFMQFWDVTMRYSDGKDIDPKWIGRWYDNAKDIMSTMDAW